ncbi:DUF4433 domain-containing protein [Bibersteinia trehalosi]|uniref:DUF4433 domain-containing protein n=2 Tax=Bibersteinia trehalosi TaxID=47735 RepID=A0A3R8LD72_BIBTR|nr:DUF4433 domain-containing protein [Bibersteinia trehalosi]
MTIQDVIKKRNIEFLVHFTRLENLDNILTNGIIPRNDLLNDKESNGKYICNDNYRYDGKCDYSCFSISFPNDKMFYTLRQNNKNTKWAVIGFSSEILMKYECLFYPCNAADGRVRDERVELFQGANALENMFYLEGREPFLDNCHPTDVQAEVMIRGVVLPSDIQFVVINDESMVNHYQKIFPNIEFIHNEDNTIAFNSRKAFIYGH